MMNFEIRECLVMNFEIRECLRLENVLVEKLK